MNTINVPFQKFFTREYIKTQIYIHHTVSPNKLHGRGIKGDVSHWNKQSFNLGTYCIIDSDGKVYQLFNHSKWSNHLGLKKATFNSYNIPYYKLDKTSIGIELDNLGPLIWTKKGYTSYAYPNSFYVPNDRVIDYGEKGFRGHRFYEAYTEEQIHSLKTLLLELTSIYDIPNHYNEDMWDVSLNALKGVPGIWTHTSVRKDKSDCAPQKELIEMLKNLEEKPIHINPIPKVPLVFTKKYLDEKELINTLSEFGWGKKIIK